MSFSKEIEFNEAAGASKISFVSAVCCLGSVMDRYLRTLHKGAAGATAD